MSFFLYTMFDYMMFVMFEFVFFCKPFPNRNSYNLGLKDRESEANKMILSRNKLYVFLFIIFIFYFLLFLFIFCFYYFIDYLIYYSNRNSFRQDFAKELNDYTYYHHFKPELQDFLAKLYYHKYAELKLLAGNDEQSLSTVQDRSYKAMDNVFQEYQTGACEWIAENCKSIKDEVEDRRTTPTFPTKLMARTNRKPILQLSKRATTAKPKSKSKLYKAKKTPNTTKSGHRFHNDHISKSKEYDSEDIDDTPTNNDNKEYPSDFEEDETIDGEAQASAATEEEDYTPNDTTQAEDQEFAQLQSEQARHKLKGNQRRKLIKTKPKMRSKATPVMFFFVCIFLLFFFGDFVLGFCVFGF